MTQKRTEYVSRPLPGLPWVDEQIGTHYYPPIYLETYKDSASGMDRPAVVEDTNPLLSDHSFQRRQYFVTSDGRILPQRSSPSDVARDYLPRYRRPKPPEAKKDMTPHPYTREILHDVHAGYAWMYGPTPKPPPEECGWWRPPDSQGEYVYVCWQPPTPTQSKKRTLGMQWEYFPSLSLTTELPPHDVYGLYSKLKEQLDGSTFNMGVFLGTSGEAFRGIADGATRLAKSIKYLKRGNIYLAAKSLLRDNEIPLKHHRVRPVNKDLSGRWLELQYGWLPLLSDVHDAGATLAHYLGQPQYKIAKASKKFEYEDGWRDGIREGYVRKSIIARIAHSNPWPQSLGLTNPWSVAWELTGYSFVVDWFVPIGDYLASLAFAEQKGEFITSTKYGYVDKCFGQTYGDFPESGWSVRFDEAATRTHMVFKREISTSLDVPLPRVKPLAKAASVGHCINAVALLLQLRK